MPKKAAEKNKEIKKPIEVPEKIIEIDEETAVLAADEEDVLTAEEEAEELEDDELGLDEEEVDPFKDKWEE